MRTVILLADDTGSEHQTIVDDTYAIPAQLRVSVAVAAIATNIISHTKYGLINDVSCNTTAADDGSLLRPNDCRYPDRKWPRRRSLALRCRNRATFPSSRQSPPPRRRASFLVAASVVATAAAVSPFFAPRPPSRPVVVRARSSPVLRSVASC